MDLRNLMNDDEKEQGRKEAHSTSATGPPQQYPSAHPSTPSHYAPSSQQQTPLYAPPSAGAATRLPPGQGMTPLRTPSHNAGSAQYPFPQQVQQSPIGGTPGQPYRPFESQPTVNQQRPGSHGQTYHPSQPVSHSSHTPIQQQHSYSSISPTPPSHLSRTPSSMRQSPLATMTHLPSQQQPQASQYSQPNTPLGPPQHYPPRPPTHPEAHSPFHQRSFSNASNGLVAGSPAQHHPGMPNLMESPSAYARPSPQAIHSRRPSEYLSHSHSQRGSRERSISVSPKTKPPPRPPSLSTRQSSNPQEMYSARSSEQYTSSVPLAGSQDHVTSQTVPQAQSQSQSRFAPYSDAASEALQAMQPSLPLTASMFPPGSQAQSALSSQTGGQAPQPHVQTQPSNISHQSEKMGMSHLMTPASEVPPQMNGASSAQPTAPANKMGSGVNIFMKKERSSTPKSRTTEAHPPSTNQSDGPVMQVSTEPRPNGNSHAADTEDQARGSLKRPASSSETLGEPPTKQQKPSRKPIERPVWARLSKHNPRFHQQGPVANPSQPRVNGGGPPRNTQPMSLPQSSNSLQPVDTDMSRIKRILGDWERSFKNTQPLSDTKRMVADWMFRELASLRDVGTDPHYGTVEVEGKIGTLFHKDTGERISLPVMATTILNAQLSEQYRFESRMQEAEHAHMNETLNAALRDSLNARGRVKMRYKHFTDIDSFQPLSATGLQALPPAIRRRVEHGRPPRLRTTVRHEKGRAPFVAARIVKVNVANLQIYSPNDPYDLRVSVNVEVNLDRPDLAPDDLTTDDAAKGEALLDRRKDRISYNHLAYQIDLTRVDVGGGGPAQQKPEKVLYELEIEVDTNLLRAQMQLALDGRESAYGDVVEGFWDNAVLLMRERAR